MPPQTDKQSDVAPPQQQAADVAHALHKDAYPEQTQPQQQVKPVVINRNVFGYSGTTGSAQPQEVKHVDLNAFSDPYGRNQLDEHARQHLRNPLEFQTFERNLNAFEARGKKEHLTSQQMANTYKNLDSMVASDDKQLTSADDRNLLALQVSDQLARPEDVRQGNYGVCGAATTEVLTYRYHPEAATSVISSVAQQGSFKTSEGTVIPADVAPSGESVKDGKTNRTPSPHERTYASQLFQEAAMGTSMADGNTPAKGATNFKYVENQNGGHAVYTDESGKELTNSDYAMTVNSMPAVYKSITGDDKITVVSRDTTVEPTAGTFSTFKSEQDLDVALRHASQPIVARVNVDAPGFDEGAATQQRDKNGREIFQDDDQRSHVVVIDGYTPATDTTPAKVQIYNTQGKDTVYGNGGEISLHQLYIDTLPRKDQIAVLQKDVTADKVTKKEDQVKELELVRLQLEERQITAAEGQSQRDAIEATMSPDQVKAYHANKRDLDDQLNHLTFVPAPTQTAVPKT
jgi:hypothetical protein